MAAKKRSSKSLPLGVVLSLILVLIAMVAVGLELKNEVMNHSLTSQKYDRPAPLFSLRDSQGKEVKLEEFRGRWVVLHFWASWCSPCIQEIPDWVETAEFLKDQPIQWVAVHLDRAWEDALKILPSSRLASNMVSLWDESGKVSDQFGSYQFPESYLISPDSKIVHKWVGPQNWRGSKLRDEIKKVVTQKP